MKKTYLILLAMVAPFVLHAQWSNDPANNNRIANTSDYVGEIYTATDPITGDTYLQWSESHSNGWSPSLQRLSFDGTPQWGTDGIHINGHGFSSSSEGIAMAATADQAVVSCFATTDDQSVAVKISADGTFPWGEQGVVLFDGNGFSRTEVAAGNDGGVWALGFDYTHLYLQYVEADGTLNPTITIADTQGYNACYGQLTLSHNNNVFVTFEKTGSGFYTEKQLYVVGFAKDGTQISPETRLMAPQSFQVTYIHRVLSDGKDGGYAYIWHPGLDNAFNTYVFHFDMNGYSSISDINGVAVHSPDPANFYLDADATIDPISGDLIIAYQQTDAAAQSQNRIYVNRITAQGEKLWGDGIMVADDIGLPYSEIKIDAYEDGNGFSIIYSKGTDITGYRTTVEAMGFDMDANPIWSQQLTTNNDAKTFCYNSTGFQLGQNIVAWANSNSGGLYGQNIAPDGTMGIQQMPEPCLAPENFKGEYVYNAEDSFGALLTWDAPETQPLWYTLYITLPDGATISASIDPTETQFFHELPTSAIVTYKLTATYEYCVSDFALTPDGEDFVSISVTGIGENTSDEIVAVLRIYSTTGQVLKCTDPNMMNAGVYILEGLTRDGRLVSKKMIVSK